MHDTRLMIVAFMLGGGVTAWAAPSFPSETDSVMGEYAGIYTPAEGAPVHAGAKVIPEGGGIYRAVLTAETNPPMAVELVRDLEGEGMLLAAAEGSAPWSGRIEGGRFAVEGGQGGGRFSLLRVERRSPTEGLAPPDGALVLLPFEPGRETSLDAWQNKNWKLLPDGSVQVYKGHNRSANDHGSGLFHIEFMLPYEPDGRGQGRGNSGVYFGSRYEIQILDSFGLQLELGDCGSIYGVAVARENACLPPLAWQTYDVIYRAPVKKADGGWEPAKMTVLHNGVLIHENQPVPGPTRAAPEQDNAARGPLYIQDHGHPVCYRNIWYLTLPD